jgi:hypothetical protein
VVHQLPLSDRKLNIYFTQLPLNYSYSIHVKQGYEISLKSGHQLLSAMCGSVIEFSVMILNKSCYSASNTIIIMGQVDSERRHMFVA